MMQKYKNILCLTQNNFIEVMCPYINYACSNTTVKISTSADIGSWQNCSILCRAQSTCQVQVLYCVEHSLPVRYRFYTV